MTTIEALDLALKLLDQKRHIERSSLKMLESRPSIAHQIDPHAAKRFQRYSRAIDTLKALKQREQQSSAAAHPETEETGTPSLALRPVGCAPSASLLPTSSNEEVQP